MPPASQAAPPAAARRATPLAQHPQVAAAPGFHWMLTCQTKYWAVGQAPEAPAALQGPVLAELGYTAAGEHRAAAAALQPKLGERRRQGGSRIHSGRAGGD